MKEGGIKSEEKEGWRSGVQLLIPLPTSLISQVIQKCREQEKQHAAQNSPVGEKGE